MKKIPIMLLKNKEKSDRFLAQGIEHLDSRDPEGDVLLTDVKDAFVIIRKDYKAPTLEDVEAVKQRSIEHKKIMTEKFGESAFVGYDVERWLEVYEPYNHEVDISTYNFIALENEWSLIGELLQVEKGDLVQLAPFDVSPTLENVVVVEEGTDQSGFVLVEGKHIGGYVPGTSHNIKKVSRVQIEGSAMSEQMRFRFEVVPGIQKVERYFTTGWESEEGIVFSVDEFEFNAVIEFPHVIVSEAESGAKITNFYNLTPAEELKSLHEWIKTEPVEYIAGVLEVVGKEKFRTMIEKGVKKQSERGMATPNEKGE